MSLENVRAELSTRLLTWQGGGWQDHSTTNKRGDVILRLGRGDAGTPGAMVFESNMSEHNMSVEQVLGVFAAGRNAVRVIKQYRG